MEKNIREAYIYEEYEIAFKDMEQIVFHIHQEIENLKDGKDAVDKIKKMIENIYLIKNKYMLSKMDSDMPKEYQLEESTKYKMELRDAVSELYYEITSRISKLNMFMPKTRIDTRLDIYKQ